MKGKRAKKKRGPSAYTEQFRREAVRLVEAEPNALYQIARDLDVHPDTLRSWWERVRLQRDQTGDGASGPIVSPARTLTLEEENRRLRRENARLTEERDILKKATAFFAKDAR